jgi:hypothetical protein
MQPELKNFISEMGATLLIALILVAVATFLTLPGSLTLLPGEVPGPDGMIARHMT